MNKKHDHTVIGKGIIHDVAMETIHTWGIF